ncbi:HK97-gp10 family putative phage morphogenesis protein [Sphingobium sp. BS19]|uniref:HK97-gp10 family putative phage morphogenesis protein n=1 Tax=Sphingobium sp. BS19 TaxID=3018973 RepID=UPI0022EE83E8|nr:HK97-gp10 family putative phage morphogenesis protein [Sphingobium sp. BS19]GLI99124.1 hypothetical protein Sbs19_29420 [Sphingobium sp. BS19]
MARLTGGDGYSRKIKRIGPEAVKQVGAVLFVAGEMVQVDAQISITSGSVSGAGHIPSAPGEAPNNDTGVLANNIETTQRAPLIVEVSSNAPYARHLEYGTSRMGERPYMRPALDKNRTEIKAMITGAVNKAIRSAG